MGIFHLISKYINAHLQTLVNADSKPNSPTGDILQIQTTTITESSIYYKIHCTAATNSATPTINSATPPPNTIPKTKH